MTSHYLTREAEERRRKALRERIAREVQYDETGAVAFWPPDSDYWKVPVAERVAICAVVREHNGAVG